MRTLMLLAFLLVCLVFLLRFLLLELAVSGSTGYQVRICSLPLIGAL